jgi:hypothetical protein
LCKTSAKADSRQAQNPLRSKKAVNAAATKMNISKIWNKCKWGGIVSIQKMKLFH